MPDAAKPPPNPPPDVKRLLAIRQSHRLLVQYRPQTVLLRIALRQKLPHPPVLQFPDVQSNRRVDSIPGN